MKAQLHEPNITLEEVRDNLKRFNDIWDQLFPLEQNRIVQLIIERIDIRLDGIDITYEPNGIMEVYEQIRETQPMNGKPARRSIFLMRTER